MRNQSARHRMPEFATLTDMPRDQTGKRCMFVEVTKETRAAAPLFGVGQSIPSERASIRDSGIACGIFAASNRHLRHWSFLQ
ncbi:hypothetical protein AF71_00015300 [Rhizobium sp. 57MFTsu3.2]|nr:hypothetical protein [Rhizobium sp. 57MFTsu3.2]